MIRGYRDAGIRHIVALRGDPAGGVGDNTAASRRLPNAADLVAGIAASADFDSRCRPTPRSILIGPSEADIDNLKPKIDAGATRAITQIFFDNDHYFRCSTACARAGINVPIVPGILPVHNFKQI